MRSLGGYQPEVPCVRCGEHIAGLGWGARCPACQAERRRRATRLARRISLLAALLAAVILSLRAAPGTDTRLWVGIGTLSTFLLARIIAFRIAMEVLRD
jgi:hypothetical protein